MQYIDTYRYEYWDGQAPIVPQQRVLVTHRPGVSGVSHQLLGRWGETFTVTLTSHWASYVDAMNNESFRKALLVGTGPKSLVYNDMAWSAWQSTLYHVNAMDIVDIRAHIYLAGPGYSYPSGASAIVRVTFTPEA